MKKYMIIYWVTTGLFSAFMLISAYSYLTDAQMRDAFAGLGFTGDYFRIELAIAKILGASALLIPLTPKVLKNFAYAGFTINIISAFIAHIANGYHSYGMLIFALLTLIISYFGFQKTQSPTNGQS